MKAQTCWDHVKTAASEAEKLRSFQQKVDASQMRQGGLAAFSRKSELQVRRSQEPSDEDEYSQNSGATAQQCKRERDRTREVLPRTMTTHVVLKPHRGGVPQTRRQSSLQRETVVNRRCTRSAQSRFMMRAGRVRVQPAGGDLRDVCSTAQMSAEVRLHSERCRESIRQAMVDETWAAQSQSERSLELYPSVGCSNHVTEGGSLHTRL